MEKVHTLPIIEIPLKPANAGTQLPTHINEVLQQEYAQQYLENIHATPTAKTVEYLLNSMPLSESLVVPVWTRELIAVVPGMSAKDAESTNVMADIFKTKRHAPVDEDPNEVMRAQTRRIWDALGNDSKSKGLHGSGGRRLSWATVNTLESVTASLLDSVGVKDIKSKSFRKLLRPLAFSDELVYNALFTFCASIVDYVPRVQQDRKYYDLICVILSSKVCLRLYGLLAHFCFWNVIHPCAKNALTTACIGDEPTKNRKSTAATIKEKLTDHDSNAENNDDDSVGSGTTVNGGANASPSGPVMLSDMNIPFNDSMSLSKNSLRENIFASYVLDEDDEKEKATGGEGQATARYADFSNGFDGINQGVFVENSLLSLASDTSLTPAEKEIMFVQIEQCLAKVHRIMGYDRIALSTALQALVTCCHFVVDAILTSVYGWLRSKSPETHSIELSGGVLVLDPVRKAVDDALIAANKARLKLRRLAHQAVSDILDPSRIHTSSMLEACMFGKHKPIKKASCRSRYYTTSVVTRSVFGDSANPEVTRFMNMANMELPYVPIPGLSNPMASRASQLFHARKLEKELKEQREREQKIKRELDMEIQHARDPLAKTAKVKDAASAKINNKEFAVTPKDGSKQLPSAKQRAKSPSGNAYSSEEDSKLPRWRGVGSSITRLRSNGRSPSPSSPFKSDSSLPFSRPGTAASDCAPYDPNIDDDQFRSARVSSPSKAKYSVKLSIKDGVVDACTVINASGNVEHINRVGSSKASGGLSRVSKNAMPTHVGNSSSLAARSQRGSGKVKSYSTSNLLPSSTNNIGEPRNSSRPGTSNELQSRSHSRSGQNSRTENINDGGQASFTSTGVRRDSQQQQQQHQLANSDPDSRRPTQITLATAAYAIIAANYEEQHEKVGQQEEEPPPVNKNLLPASKSTAKDSAGVNIRFATCKKTGPMSEGDLYHARLMRSAKETQKHNPFTNGTIQKILLSEQNQTNNRSTINDALFETKNTFQSVNSRIRQVKSWHNREAYDVPIPLELLKASASRAGLQVDYSLLEAMNRNNDAATVEKEGLAPVDAEQTARSPAALSSVRSNRSSNQLGIDTGRSAAARSASSLSSIGPSSLPKPKSKGKPVDYKQLFEDYDLSLITRVEVTDDLDESDNESNAASNSHSRPFTVASDVARQGVSHHHTHQHDQRHHHHLHTLHPAPHSHLGDMAPSDPINKASTAGLSSARHAVHVNVSRSSKGARVSSPGSVGTPGYPSVVPPLTANGLATESISVSAGNISMVENENAQMPISKKGREQLMDLLVKRAASHYSHKNIMSQFSRTPGAYQRQNLILSKR